MNNIKTLVEELRKRGLSNGASTGYHSGLMDETADMLERLQAELKTAKAEAYKEFVDKANEIIDLIIDLMFDDSVSKCQLPSCHKPSSIPCENEICIQENKEYWHSKFDNLLKELVGES